MAWSTNKTWSPGEDLTADLMNQYVRDQLDETAPAIATTGSRLIVTDGANSIAERELALDTVLPGESLTGTAAWTDLATSGPAVTVTCGELALVTVTCTMVCDTIGVTTGMSFAVSGASTLAASTNRAFLVEHSRIATSIGASFQFLYVTTPGSNTFTSKYYCSNSGAEGTYSARYIHVIPF